MGCSCGKPGTNLVSTSTLQSELQPRRTEARASEWSSARMVTCRGQEIASQPAARCGAARPCERPGLRAAQRSYRPRAPADMKRRCGGTASAQLVGQIGIGRRMAGREIDSRTVMARFKLTHGDLAHRQSSGIAVRTIAQCKTQSSARCFFWVGDSSVLCVWHSCTKRPKR